MAGHRRRRRPDADVRRGAGRRRPVLGGRGQPGARQRRGDDPGADAPHGPRRFRGGGPHVLPPAEGQHPRGGPRPPAGVARPHAAPVREGATAPRRGGDRRRQGRGGLPADAAPHGPRPHRRRRVLPRRQDHLPPDNGHRRLQSLCCPSTRQVCGHPGATGRRRSTGRPAYRVPSSASSARRTATRAPRTWRR